MEDAVEETKGSKKTNKPKEIKRVYKNELKIDSDKFKLLEADCIKNEGFHVDHPSLSRKPHVHHYYSVDSNGKKQIYCGSIAGHAHKCEVFESNGELMLHVGPAIQIHAGKERANMIVPASPNRPGHQEAMYDNHTHEAVYVGSDEILHRKQSQQALADIANRTNLEASLGV